MAAADLTYARLRELLIYDPDTGAFAWRRRRCRYSAGDRAGSLREDRYFTVRLDGRPYRTNRLAWLYMTGEWPPHLIDHEDQNPANDRWKNLRLATHSQNHQNQKMRSDNTCGFRGIEKHTSGLWRARLTVRGKRVLLGYFKTPQEAYDARIEGERIHFTHSPACAPPSSDLSSRAPLGATESQR